MIEKLYSVTFIGKVKAMVSKRLNLKLKRYHHEVFEAVDEHAALERIHKVYEEVEIIAVKHKRNKFFMVHVVQGFTGTWEDLTESDVYAEAAGNYWDYVENEPATSHKLISRRQMTQQYAATFKQAI